MLWHLYIAPLINQVSDLWDDCWYKIVWRQNSIKTFLSWESFISPYFAAISPFIPLAWQSPMTWKKWEHSYKYSCQKEPRTAFSKRKKNPGPTPSEDDPDQVECASITFFVNYTQACVPLPTTTGSNTWISTLIVGLPLQRFELRYHEQHCLFIIFRKHLG
jgi:hypothetical protein